MTENNNQYNKIILDAYNRSKEIAKEKEFKPNEKATTNVVEFKTENLDTLAARRAKERVEITKTNIAKSYKTATKNIIIVALIACVLLIPGIRNGILGLIGNPILTGLNVIWLFCLIYPICYLGYKLLKFIFEPIIYALQERKKLKGSSQYNK